MIDAKFHCKILQISVLSPGKGTTQPRSSACICHTFFALTDCGWAHSGTNPNSRNDLYSRTVFLLFSIGFPFSDPSAPPRIGWRGRPARERGLINENNPMLLALAQPRKAPSNHLLHRRPCLGRILQEAGSQKPKAGSRKQKILSRRDFPGPLLRLPIISRHLFRIQLQALA
jgi:hypothetical protein